MLNNARLFLILFIFSILSHLLYAKQSLDSVLLNRDHQLTEYYRFKDGMKERTWINLVNLNNKALQLIETDNLILDNHLKLEMNRSKEISDKLEKANLEKLLLNREIQVKATMLEEQRFLNTNLVIATGLAFILFVVILILFIDRHIRYRSTRMELERSWSKHHEPLLSTNKTEGISKQQNEINSLLEQNKTIKLQLEELSNQKRAQDKQLQFEINSRNKVEKEIKSLISQIKKLS